MKQRLTYLVGAALAVGVSALLLAQGPPPGRGPGGGKGLPKGPPQYRLEKGQPIETREPEKSDDKPVFAGQTRAPYRWCAGRPGCSTA